MTQIDDEALKAVAQNVSDDTTPPPLADIKSRAQRRQRQLVLNSGAAVLVLVGAVTAGVYLSGGSDQDTLQPAGPGPQDSASAAKSVDVRCDAAGNASVTPATVQAQADGVHVHLVNDTGTQVFVHGLDLDAKAGTSDVVSTTGPSDVQLSCETSSASTTTGQPADLQIVDPQNYWHDAGLQCPAGEGVRGTTVDSIGGARGETGTPVDIARAHMQGLQSGDAVEQAGYPDQSYPVVRVVRDGDVVAVVRLASAQRRAWLVTGLDACSSAGVTLN